MIQATYWQAQLNDGTKMRGGQTNLRETDTNVAAVPIDQIKVFTVTHNTFAWSYFAPTKTWYKDGKPATLVYPTEFIMQDGSVVTIDKDVATGLLKLTQAY
jgi:inorganic pyrophosphatase